MIRRALLLAAFVAACSEPPASPPGERGTGKDMGEAVDEVSQGEPIPLYDPAAVVWAVNLGGGAHRDIEGVNFAADTLDAETSAGNIEGIKGAQDTTVYSSFRAGPLRLEQSVPDGTYDLTLYFAEPADTAIGDRLFNVKVQDDIAIHALDIRQARDGQPRSALVRSIPGIAVNDGRFRLGLESVAGEPVLSAFALRFRSVDPRDWTLVWSDEFHYEGPPDPDKWNIEIWDARRVNDEDQAYTNRAKNLRVENSRLVIEAHREAYGDAEYTSGRIHSRGKGDWLYGRIDMRARLPGGQGTWPALWMLPTDAFRYATSCSNDPDEWQGEKGCDAWPNSGEIDIMEHVGYDMHRLHGTVHNRAYYHINNEQRKASMEVRGLERDFHVYSLEWSPDIIRIFFDGIPYFAYVNEGEGWESWPYDHPYHLILNLAIGGNWGRAGGPIDDSIFPVRLEVDYVRVFEPASGSGGGAAVAGITGNL